MAFFLSYKAAGGILAVGDNDVYSRAYKYAAAFGFDGRPALSPVSEG